MTEDVREERCARCYHLLSARRCPKCGWEDLPLGPNPSSTGEGPSPGGAADPDPFSWPEGGDSPAPPGSPPGEASSPASLAPPLLHPRRATWLLLAAAIGIYFVSGGSFSLPLTEARALSLGALHGEVFGNFANEGWRLLAASGVHTSFWVLLVACFMIWSQAGLAERLGGSGLVLGLFVVGGAALNVLRCGLEAPASLLLLAGAWPPALACGGAAVSLAARAKLGAGRALFSLAFEVGILAWIAFQGHLLTPGLAGVAACSFGLGLFVGSTWPRPPGGLGVFAAFASAGLVALALAERGAEDPTPLPPPREWRERNPAEWQAWQEKHPEARPSESDLEPQSLAELGLRLELPPAWKRSPLPERRDCPQCGASVERSPQEAAEGRAATCPSCGAKVAFGKRPRQVLFQEASLLGPGHQLLVWAAPRSPFDAPDTLATRFVAELTRAGSWFAGGELVEERDFQSAGFPRGYLAVLRGRSGGRELLMRLYLFVDERRTILLRGLGPTPADPFAAEKEAELYDRIAASLRPL